LEARFVEEYQVGLALPRFADDAWEFICLPALHLLAITLAGPPLRLMAGPAEALLKDLAYVFGVVVDAELLADESGHAFRSPKVIGPAMGLGAL
jgi:hypothetical protein